MITKEQIATAYKKILALRVAKLGDSARGIFLQPVEFGNKLHLSSLVYTGDRFIPNSVRLACNTVTKKSPLSSWLTIDEERYEIFHHVIAESKLLTEDELFELTSIFAELSDDWRALFEQKDREDLVHVLS